MPKPADIGCKRLISLDPNTWAEWVTGIPGLLTRDILTSEFQWISRESDVVIRVKSSEQGEFLILNEIQLRYNSRVPKRMTAYAALAREKYDLPVFPVLVNILPPNQDPKIPHRYRSKFLGLKALQEYKVLNLWEVDVNLVFSQPLPSLLPFVPVLKGGNAEGILREAVRELRGNEELKDFEPLLTFFAGFVLELGLVQEILRWDMVVLRESPWYEQILQEGKQAGKEEGIQIGEERGIQIGQKDLTLRQLRRKLGSLPPELATQIQELSMTSLEQLAEDLLDFGSMSDLIQWLETHP